MENFFLGLIGFILFIYVGYPLCTLILSVLFGQSVKKNDEELPSVSLLIAAYNEEKIIERKILNALEIDYPREKLDIVVVSDGSTDRTDEITNYYRTRGVQLFRVEGRVGKTQARNQAVLASRKEIIVFSDATAMFNKDVIRKIVRNFADKKVGMVSGNLVYRNEKKSAIGLVTQIYWAYESLIKRAQSRLFSLTGSVGCLNAFRRHLYHVLPPNIIEDFTQPLMILAQNYKVVYEAEAVAYERTTQKPEQEFLMRVRVIRGGMHGLIYALRQLSFMKHQGIIAQLFFHKVLRWMVPFFLIQLFIVNVYCFLTLNSPLIDMAMLLQFAFYLFGVLGIFTRIPGPLGKLFSFPTYFIVVNAASLKAMYLTLTTDLEATWETNVY